MCWAFEEIAKKTSEMSSRRHNSRFSLIIFHFEFNSLRNHQIKLRIYSCPISLAQHWRTRRRTECRFATACCYATPSDLSLEKFTSHTQFLALYATWEICQEHTSCAKISQLTECTPTNERCANFFKQLESILIPWFPLAPNELKVILFGRKMFAESGILIASCVQKTTTTAWTNTYKSHSM